jgi:chaperone required for assembly of F1-ATPase
MRDFLEDAEKHRSDGYGRAQAHAGQNLPKRFYKQAGTVPAVGGYSVTLDGRPTKTPGRKPAIVPSAELAAAMAGEWAAQGEFIDPDTMPLVRLVNAAIEGGEERASELREEIVKYAANDLLLYRADAPKELVAEQERLWDDALVRIARHFAVGFRPTIGIVHQAQPESTLAKLADALRDENLLALAAILSITSITGSGLLAMAVRHDLLTPDEAWGAAHVDEDYNVRLWGAVEEAILRREKRRREFDAAVKLLAMAGA